jgi:prolipoprotein diacylglyceryltransferase
MATAAITANALKNTSGHVITTLLGANIPMSIFWTQVLPQYDESENQIVQMFEGVLAIVGALLGTVMLAEAINPANVYLTMPSVHVLVTPYFCYNALMKLRRVVDSIAQELSPYKQ